MCTAHDGHADSAQPPWAGRSTDISRRSLFGAASVLAAVGLGIPLTQANRAVAAAPVLNAHGDLARTMAMHIHSSFSEGPGSMQAQLAEATRLGVDVLWWTDHDWRMAGAGYRTTVHFDSLTAEAEAGYPWRWTAAPVGAIAASGGGVVSSPVSPGDPSPIPGALGVHCVSAGTAEASYRWYADEGKSRLNARSNVRGLTVDVDVLATEIGDDAWLELLASFSSRPAMAGRPAGQYLVSYRFGSGPARREVRGSLGIVWVPVDVTCWTTVTLTPEDDIAALWPDVPAADNSFGRLWLGATSRKSAPASGYFDYLRFQRTQLGADTYAVQTALMADYAAAYPSVLQLQGLEISYFSEHLNWFGGTPTFQDSSTWLKAYPKSKIPSYVLASQQAAYIHAGGGLASLNHPFGTGFGVSLADTTAARHTIVNGLLTSAPAFDVLEVGYQERVANLRGHLMLWDTLLRSGQYLTGTGVSDDHDGERNGWSKSKDRFSTGAWTQTLDEAALLSAISGGRVYCRELGQVGPSLDLEIAGDAAHMGQVLVGNVDAEVSLRVLAPGLPPGSAVRVVQGAVEEGARALDPSSVTVATIPAGDFIAGERTLTVSNSVSSFTRVEVVDQVGRCIAFSNPVWLLDHDPVTPVPAARVPAA